MVINRATDDSLFFDRYHGCTAIVLGAAHSVTQYIARGLIRRGVYVVAIDTDGAALRRLISTNPERIEVVEQDPESDEAMSLLLEEWGDMPLDFLVAAPHLDMIDFGADRLMTQGLRRFGALLSASGGRALCLSDAVDEGMFNAYGAWAIAEAKTAFMHDYELEGEFSVEVLQVDVAASPAVIAARGLGMLTPHFGAAQPVPPPLAAVSGRAG